ncbi:MAG: hypothetical protein D6E12_00440 [Desulfovibrio sp.]|nr:MAG: hypothetical protein D6E12_00440 [Desulfovibrio sp.]
MSRQVSLCKACGFFLAPLMVLLLLMAELGFAQAPLAEALATETEAAEDAEPEPADSPSQEDIWAPVVERLVAQGLDRGQLTELFSRPEAVFDPEPMSRKLNGLFKTAFGSSRIERMQRNLAFLEHDPGAVDGVYGDATHAAIRSFQRERGLRVDGLPSADTAFEVRAAAERKRGREIRRNPAYANTAGGSVYRSVMKPERLAEAREFYVTSRALIRRMEIQYNVPGQVAAGIVAVETRAGRYLGVTPALTTLASMALCRDFSLVEEMFAHKELSEEQMGWVRETAARKADWALREAAALIEYSGQAGVDPFSLPGSLYGAIGVSQFMPTSALKWGVDGDQDGRLDLFTVEDAVMSLGNFLVEHGWEGGSEDVVRAALYRYNHSNRYVNTVLAVAEHIALAEVNATLPREAHVVDVAGVEELLGAVGPDRILALGPGEYDFSGEWEIEGNPHVTVHGSGPSAWVEIRDVENLVLVSEQGAAITAGEQAEHVLRFVRCPGLVLDNMSVVQANATEPRSAVLGISESDGAHIQDVALLSSGGLGLEVVQSRDVALSNLHVTGSRNGALVLDHVRDVLVGNGVFLDNHGPFVVGIVDADSVQLLQCVLRDNTCTDEHLVNVDAQSESILALHSYVAGNTALGLVNNEQRLEVEDTECRNNAFGP